MCVSNYESSFVHLFTYFVWPFTFFVKFDSDITITLKLYFVPSVTSIIIIMVKLSQMIWGYVTLF